MLDIGEIPRRVTEEVFNSHDASAVDKFYAAHFLWHGPGGIKICRDQFREAIGDYFVAFSNFVMEVEKQVVSGDVVATRWIASGTHDGEYLGVPPTGRRVTFTGTAIERVEDDLIVEGWEDIDMYGLIKTIGGVNPLDVS